MPRIRNVAPWAKALRDQVRQLAKGWTVRESPKSGRVMLKVRGETEQAITLPFEWTASESGDAYIRIRNIYKLVGEGQTLKGAAEIADGRAPKPVMDWYGAAGAYQERSPLGVLL
jgi:hypothetical protein